MAAEPRTEPTEFNRQFAELVYQGLETEIGGVQVYETALKCAVNEDLKEEWTKYLEQTQRHEEIMRDLVADLGLDPEEETPGRAVVRHIGQSLLKAMEMSLAAGDPAARTARGMRVRCARRDQGSPELGTPRRGAEDAEG
jgi:hypothetical protein